MSLNTRIRTTFTAAMIAGSLALGGTALADHNHEHGAEDDHGHGLAVASGTYVMDKTHGYVTFTYSHFGLSNPQISFDDVDATINLNADTPADSTISVSIDASSIDSGVPVFNDHLNSENWFNTEAHPAITFTSTGLVQTDGTTGTLTGDLTIKDVTQPVTLDVTLLGAMEHPLSKKDTVGVEATTTVLRSDFGLGAYAPAVSDEIAITISGEFNKAE